MKLSFRIVYILLTLWSLQSCSLYKNNIYFRIAEEELDTLDRISNSASENYLIATNDYLTISVYTSNGEMLIDPEKQFLQGNNGANIMNNTNNISVNKRKYLVDPNGFVTLPMVGRVKIDSLTLPQANNMLSLKYNVYYDSSFVLTTCENRRVVVLGALGNQVVPLENENMNLLEVLALTNGVNDIKVNNIRIIRGDLKNPQVEIVDLTTIEGMRKANLKVENHDVIYIQPRRKVLTEIVRDISPILSLTTSLVTLLFIFNSK